MLHHIHEIMIEELNIEAIKYGLKVRLVNENDAEKIVQLRTDTTLSLHILKTDANVDKQKKYIRDYKIRELNGLEYYFAYSDIEGAEPIGFYRVHTIDFQNKSFTIGSWIFERNVLVRLPIIADILSKSFGFIQLNLETCYFDVRRNNKKVLRYHKLFSPIFIREDNEGNNFFYLKKEDFKKNVNDILKILI